MCGHPNTAMLRTAVAFVTRATCDRCRMGACGADDPPARHGGRKLSVNEREVLDGIFYIL